jgi:ArsR family transcriptional regulator, arsenate/arsenite/antimonite-responsive transcriptional repressor / arsenate reductase (thioredoxin)
MNVEASRASRAAVHAALGDPARLAVVDELLLGDRSPSELGAALHMPSNLLAHHLGVLQRVGLIERRRSEADGRRVYVRLVPSTLASLVPPVTVAAARVVFVCTHNSARSQLAAAAWSRRSEVPVASAGTHPAPRVHRRAISVARRHGLRLAGARTAPVEAVVRPADLVVAVCDSAYEELGPTRERLHWSVPDPVPVGTDAAFEGAYQDVEERVGRLVTAVDHTMAGRSR